jgi:hypothetical protein
MGGMTMKRMLKLSGIILAVLFTIIFTQIPSAAIAISGKNQTVSVSAASAKPVKAVPESTISKSQIVYWVSGSKVYHVNRSCKTLARSKHIYSGTLKQAIAAGHTKPCKVCSK